MLSSSLNDTLTESDPHTGLSFLEIRRQSYPKWAHHILGTLLLLFGCIGLVLNVCVLVTFIKKKKLRSPSNTFVIGLAVSDLCMVVLGVPWSTMACLNGQWFVSNVFCVFEAFIVYGFGMTSLHLLTSISIDRYIVVVKPLKAQMITQRSAICSIIVCYVGGFFWAVLPFVGWSSYGLEAPGVSCGLSYEDQSFSRMTYTVTIFIFAFMLPLGIMIYCYFCIYLTVRRITRDSVWDKKSRKEKKQLQIERKVLRSRVIMCGAFWCCWFPYAVATFWAAFGNPDTVPLVVTAIPAAAAKTQVVWNPLLYVITNKQFRRSFYEILPCTGLREMLLKQEEKGQGSKASALDLDSNQENEAQDKVSAEAAANPNAVTPEENDCLPKVEC